MNQRYKRKRFYFKDSFQGKYILSCFLIAGIVAVLYTLLLIFLSSDTLTMNYDRDGLTLADTPSVLMDTILSIHGILVLLLGFFILFVVTRLTHRSAGPIYKINQTLNTMATGNIAQEIHLRKNDEHKELAEKINQFNMALFEKIKEIEHASQALDAYLNGNDMEDIPLITNKDRQASYTHPLIAINNQLKTSLEFFSNSAKEIE